MSLAAAAATDFGVNPRSCRLARVVRSTLPLPGRAPGRHDARRRGAECGGGRLHADQPAIVGRHRGNRQWGTNPWARGRCSWPRPGQDGRNRVAARPPQIARQRLGEASAMAARASGFACAQEGVHLGPPGSRRTAGRTGRPGGRAGWRRRRRGPRRLRDLGGAAIAVAIMPRIQRGLAARPRTIAGDLLGERPRTFGASGARCRRGRARGARRGCGGGGEPALVRGEVVAVEQVDLGVVLRVHEGVGGDDAAREAIRHPAAPSQTCAIGVARRARDRRPPSSGARRHAPRSSSALDAGAITPGRGAEDARAVARRNASPARPRAARRGGFHSSAASSRAAIARTALSNSAICASKASRNRPEMRRVTSTRGRSSSASGRISMPVTRAEPSSQTGRAPIRTSASARSSPPVRIVALPHRSSTSARGHSPWSCRWRRRSFLGRALARARRPCGSAPRGDRRRRGCARSAARRRGRASARRPGRAARTARRAPPAAPRARPARRRRAARQRRSSAGRDGAARRARRRRAGAGRGRRRAGRRGCCRSFTSHR